MKTWYWIGVIACIWVGIGVAIYTKPTSLLDISTWVVDWDLDRGKEELPLYNWSSIQYFATYFNEEDEFMIDDQLVYQLEKQEAPVYLSVVNDLILLEGGSIQKDSELVRRLLEDEHHLQNLVELARDLKVEGLELDYENIPSELWPVYVAFIERLGKALKAIDKELRVVLEPKAPIDQLDWPDEIEYVMMAYNLYGYHSGPGPKADLAFIQSLCEKVRLYLPNVRLAFSLGGFDWKLGEKPKALTMIEAQALAQERNVDYHRDAFSGALYFVYTDDLNEVHEVWFSDAVTIEAWIKEAQKDQINKFALWRLGGNK